MMHSKCDEMHSFSCFCIQSRQSLQREARTFATYLSRSFGGQGNDLLKLYNNGEYLRSVIQHVSWNAYSYKIIDSMRQVWLASCDVCKLSLETNTP